MKKSTHAVTFAQKAEKATIIDEVGARASRTQVIGNKAREFKRNSINFIK